MRVRGCIKERVKEVEEGVRAKGDWDLPSEEMWEAGEAETWSGLFYN